MSLIARSHRLDKRDEPADVNRLDWPARWGRQRLRDGGMLEYYVASAGPMDVDAMCASNGFQGSDPPIAGVRPHPVERPIGARHVRFTSFR
jgi:hypothetical protein